MSASTERKNRVAAREAGTDKKTLAAQEAASKAKKSKLRWTLGTVLVVLLIAAILFFNSALFYRSATAVSIGSRNYSAAETSYYYGSSYMNFMNTYGSYASMFGLDTSAGYAGLASTDCPMIEDGTWRDYFLEAAESDMTQAKALSEYAKANGVSLSEEEKADVQEALDTLTSAAKDYGFKNVNRYLEALYGKGVNSSLIRRCMNERALAAAAYTAYVDSLEYTPEQLEEKYQSYNGEKDLFHFAVYTVSADIPEDADEATKATLSVEARATANAIAVGFQERESDEYVEELNAAVDHEVPGAQASERKNVSGSSVDSSYVDWMMDAGRKAGDNTVVENADGSAFTVVVFLDRNDNHYATVSVRHILVKVEADENGAYTDEAKAAALQEAEAILAEWKAGEATEESFAALANEKSEDGGSNTTGGLYEEIYKGQMVSEFDAFCFEGHKSGDTGIVYGESGSYAGYHVIYFVGEGELYSNVIAKNDLSGTASDEWLTGLTSELEAKHRYGLKLVG